MTENENDVKAGLPDGTWYIFIPKIPFWVYFGTPWSKKCWYILRPVEIFYSDFG
jgi:hypothetical protein